MSGDVVVINVFLYMIKQLKEFIPLSRIISLEVKLMNFLKGSEKYRLIRYSNEYEKLFNKKIVFTNNDENYEELIMQVFENYSSKIREDKVNLKTLFYEKIKIQDKINSCILVDNSGEFLTYSAIQISILVGVVGIGIIKSWLYLVIPVLVMSVGIFSLKIIHYDNFNYKRSFLILCSNILNQIEKEITERDLKEKEEAKKRETQLSIEHYMNRGKLFKSSSAISMKEIASDTQKIVKKQNIFKRIFEKNKKG